MGMRYTYIHIDPGSWTGESICAVSQSCKDQSLCGGLPFMSQQHRQGLVDMLDSSLTDCDKQSAGLHHAISSE